MRGASSFDWESLLIGQAVPRAKRRWLLAAHSAALRVARAFDRSGLAGALGAMDRITAHREARRALAALPAEMRTFLAQEVVWQTRGLVRTFYGERLCLFEALATTAALRALGLPAAVIVGYATGSGARRTPVHAWAALDGIPVTDSGYVWQRYTEITRYPHERKGVSCAG
ncbi:lasso peptide biosynthesis protein [Amycolatopsis anabasis]|uniref:lasso peptide biosynthesis protein n=1 Tax=Amycolatopsis anabasis TaxID=1840409 RepID=UPI00131D6B2E|nr:lasso peptide biosynthesis protein [Amycolatopsis anabasis]